MLNLIGERYGRLVVLSEGPGRPRWQRTWYCHCDCGTVKLVSHSNLRAGKAQSCGCYKLERIKATATRHGRSGSSIHNIWMNMRQRCRNPKNKRYWEYGGRGITVCDRWQIFENFLADMGERPSLKHSLDRINCNGNYEPGNVRWATATQQANNTRWNHQILYDGRVQTMAEWGREIGIDPQLICCRIERGWTEEMALEIQPVPTKLRLVSHAGETLTVAEWARRTGLPSRTIADRLNRGWSTTDALTTPSYRPLYTFQGLSLPLCEWARRTGVSEPLILGRIKRLGWSLERALSTPTRPFRRRS